LDHFGTHKVMLAYPKRRGRRDPDIEKGSERSGSEEGEGFVNCENVEEGYQREGGIPVKNRSGGQHGQNRRVHRAYQGSQLEEKVGPKVEDASRDYGDGTKGPLKVKKIRQARKKI